MSKILLHTCCGPCTTYVNKWLQENNFTVTGFFYNPNIFPAEEYNKRREFMQRYADLVDLNVIYESHDQNSQAGQCVGCYQHRLSKTAQRAKELSSDCFSTTLLISPYQKIDLIKEVGEEVGKRYNIAFFYKDFRDGYRESRQMSKDMSLYRQKYCGCSAPSNLREEVCDAKVS